MVHPVTPAFLKGLALGDWVFGIVYAMMAFFNFSGSLLWAQWVSKISFKLAISINILLYALGQAIFAFSTTVPQILLARSIAGFASGAFQVSLLAYIVATTQQTQRASVLSNFTYLTVIGSTIGYFLGGRIGNTNPLWAFYGQVILTAFIALLWFVFMNSQTVNPANQAIAPQSVFTAFKITLKHAKKSIWIFFLAVLSIACAGVVFDQSFNYYVKDQLNFMPSHIGGIKIVIGLCSTLLNFTIIKWMIQKFSLLNSLSLLLLLAIVMGSMSLSSPFNPIFIVGSIGIIVLSLMTQPFTQQQTSLLSTIAEETNRYLGIYNAARSLGGVIGGIMASWLYIQSVSLPFWITLGLLLLALLLIGIIKGGLHDKNVSRIV